MPPSLLSLAIEIQTGDMPASSSFSLQAKITCVKSGLPSVSRSGRYVSPLNTGVKTMPSDVSSLHAGKALKSKGLPNLRNLNNSFTSKNQRWSFELPVGFPLHQPQEGSLKTNIATQTNFGTLPGPEQSLMEDAGPLAPLCRRSDPARGESEISI